MVIRKRDLKKWISLLIILSPILNIYKVATLPLSFGDLALCIVIVISIFLTSSFHYIIKKENFNFLPIFIMFIFTTIITIVIQGRGFNASDLMSKWSRLLVYGILLDIIVPKYIDLTFAKRVLVKLTVFLSITLIIQEFMKDIGIIILPYLRSLPLNYNTSMADLISSIYRRHSLGIWRVSTIFPEPAHFSYFGLAGLLVILFGSDPTLLKKKDFISAGFTTIALIICGSAIGYFVAGVTWLIWMIYNFREKITIKAIVKLIILIVIAVILFFRTGALQKALYRLGTILSYSEGATGGVRLLQGIYVFKQLNIAEQIFGIGFGNVAFFLLSNSITTPFLLEIGNEYMNAFSTILVSGGVIGLSVYLWVWFKLLKNNKSILSRSTWLIISILFCSANIFYSCTMILFIVLIISKKEFDGRIQ